MQSFENLQGESRYQEQEQSASYSHQPSQPQPQIVVQTIYMQQQVEGVNGSALGGAFSYIFGWLSGLLMFLFAGQNRFVRFHALQSLIFFGGINVLDIMLVGFADKVLRFIPVHFLLGTALLVFVILQLVTFVGWLIAIIQAGRGVYFKLPIAGSIAERAIGPEPVLK